MRKNQDMIKRRKKFTYTPKHKKWRKTYFKRFNRFFFKKKLGKTTYLPFSGYRSEKLRRHEKWEKNKRCKNQNKHTKIRHETWITPSVPLDHDLLCVHLPDDFLPVFLLALQSRWQCAPPHLKHPSRGPDDLFLCLMRESWPRINIYEIWVSTSTRVTRLGITNSSNKLRLLVRHDIQKCIFRSS